MAFGVHLADGSDLSLVCSWEVCSREGWTTVCSGQSQGNHPTREIDEAVQNKRKMRYWQSKPLFRVCSGASEFQEHGPGIPERFWASLSTLIDTCYSDVCAFIKDG